MEYKPLMSLEEDPIACCQIFEHIVGDEIEYGCVKKVQVNNHEWLILWEFKPNYYDDAEPLHHVYIHHDGGITWMKGEMVIHDYNVFSLVDFIRSLGYSA